MFTGIIEEIGPVAQVVRSGSGSRLKITAPGISPELAPGESVSIDGVCTTVEETGRDGFWITASPETLSRTTLGSLRRGERVNLERAIVAGGRFGGHFVQGHVDGTTKVVDIKRGGDFLAMRFHLPAQSRVLVVEKGSVAINGVSLTVSRLGKEDFAVDLVPFTLGKTNLLDLKVGACVNIEYDVIAKMVFRMVRSAAREGGLTLSMLEEHGYISGGDGVR